MPTLKAKTKLAGRVHTSWRMMLPLLVLLVASGVVLVVSSFASAVYPTNYVNTIYIQAFSRAVDSGGVSYWQGYFRSNGCTATTLFNMAKTVYGGDEFAHVNYSSGDTVARIYRGALQREPDSSGYSYWQNQLNGGASRTSVALAIINGSQSEFSSRIAPVACAETQPNPNPNPNPNPTPTPTPTPTPSPRPSGGGSRSGGGTTTPSTTADTQAPSKPGNLVAETADDSSAVRLSWDAATDNTGVAGYKVERSTDGTNWTKLNDAVDGTELMDRTVGFKTKYQYRVQAYDAAGNAGEFATASVETGDFNVNATSDGDTLLASDDNGVLISLPAGALPGDAHCSLESANDNLLELKNGLRSRVVLIGPYLLSCKTADGDSVTTFDKAATVTVLPLKTKVKGYGGFQVYGYDANAEKWVAVKTTLDKKTKSYRFTTTSSLQVALVGQKSKNYWPLFLSIFLPTALIGGLAFWYYQQKLKKQQYADYIKKKYYNL